MPAYLHHIETGVPPHRHSQEFITEQLSSFAGDERTRRLILAGGKRSGIEYRHSVCDGIRGCAPFDDRGKASTAVRNAVYGRESRKLAVEVADRAIAATVGLEKSDITHVIFTSCTGFVNPGPDYFLVKDLGLNEGVERYTIGFMGCYAAFPTLRIAKSFCDSDSDAVVLAVCLELSTLHLRLDGRTDTIRGNAVFADGAAAAIVSAREPAPDSACYELGRFATATIPDSEDEMAWSIGDEGFDLSLSSYVPSVIESEIAGILERLSIDCGSIDHWALHPGGKAIIDKVEKAMGLGGDDLSVSREVLRRYGNMSSATILFVLKEMLKISEDGNQTAAIAFGPGLTVETARLTTRTHRSAITIDEAPETAQHAALAL